MSVYVIHVAFSCFPVLLFYRWPPIVRYPCPVYSAKYFHSVVCLLLFLFPFIIFLNSGAPKESMCAGRDCSPALNVLAGPPTDNGKQPASLPPDAGWKTPPTAMDDQFLYGVYVPPAAYGKLHNRGNIDESAVGLLSVPYGGAQDWRWSNEWETSMLGAPCSEPLFCLSACCCPWCCAFLQRKKLLENDWSRYLCCAGMFCGRRCCVCEGCEPCCLCLESCFCLACAVYGNRFIIRKHYNLQNDCCDLLLMSCCPLCCCLAFVIDDERFNLFVGTWGVAFACMLAQHQQQMKKQGYPWCRIMK